MPAPDSFFIRTAQQTTIHVSLEPAHNVLYSMMILNKVNELSGYNPWIVDTAESLTPEQAHKNLLVFEGLHYAINPKQSWPSFSAYLEHLALQDPIKLRDAILEAYINLPCKTDEPDTANFNQPSDMLATLGTFLDYLQSRFAGMDINLAIETEAYALLKEPPAMQKLIVSHLREMWITHFAAEWERVTPMLAASTQAFQQVDLQSMSPLEATRQVIGQEVPQGWQKVFEKPDLAELIFVPSAHLGPYWGIFKSKQKLYLLFGARSPEGVAVQSPDLSRSEVLVRLSALSDDTRLQILQMLGQEGELCSKDLKTRLGLSQSATSRHLKQLTATGILDEKWRDGAKCYSLSEARIEQTLSAVKQFLLG